MVVTSTLLPGKQQKHVAIFHLMFEWNSKLEDALESAVSDARLIQMIEEVLLECIIILRRYDATIE